MSQQYDLMLDDKETSNISGLYVHDDTLTVLSAGSGHAYSPGGEIMMDMWYPVQSSYKLAFYDTSAINDPKLNQSFTVDGYIISSRKIDNKLYVVSTFAPQIDDIITHATTDEEKLHNFNLLSKTSIADLMPTYTDKAGLKHALVDPSSCLYPQDATAKDGNYNMVIMSVIDMDAPNSMKSSCVSAHANGIYVSKNSVYLYGVKMDSESTQGVIHKFSMVDDGVKYQASGNVNGDFGGENSHFRFSENEQYLRVISTYYDKDYRPQHQLSIFKSLADNSALELVSQLPNADQPEKIGKENESIYAVRYFADKAYVVTFERIDPLYVIDLKDPSAPAIQGALEIPGYSAYLHPISADLLLGVGQHINANNLPQSGSTDQVTTQVVEEGAQVSLFDVSDPTSPKQLSKIVYANGYTPAQFNYHALTYLKVDEDNHMLALPIETWQTSRPDDSASLSIWSANVTLELLEINGQGSDALLKKAGSIATKSTDNFISSWDDRSIIHGDDIYYIHGNQVWHSRWSDPMSVDGPY